MAPDSARLLDALVGESSLRVTCYARAVDLAKKAYPKPDTQAAAELFYDFVAGEHWKVDVLSMVIGTANHRSTVAKILVSAEQIARWVTGEEDEPIRLEAVADPPLKPPVVSKKTRKKKTT